MEVKTGKVVPCSCVGEVLGVTDQLRSVVGGGGINNAATANGSHDSRSAQPSPLLQPGRAVTRSSPGRSENSDAVAHTSPTPSFHPEVKHCVRYETCNSEQGKLVLALSDPVLKEIKLTSVQ